jgi:hypothetical protein
MVHLNSRETLCQFDDSDQVGWRWQVLAHSAEGTSLLFIWLFTFWSGVHLDVHGRGSGMFLVGISWTNVATS